MKRLFTERHGQAKPRIAEVLDEPTRNGLLGLVSSLIEQEWFGFSFPQKCPDGTANAGCDTDSLRTMMVAYDLLYPSQQEVPPSDGKVFDLLEFSYEKIALPQQGGWHDYFRHHHFDYDQAAGRYRFQEEVNRLFERNGIALELKEGEVVRIASAGFQETLASAVFQTGDPALDEMLEDARRKFLNRDLKVRKESLEELWDAWERLKTLEPGDKKASVKAILDRSAAEPLFRQVLEEEAVALTKIGNAFMIRHSELGKIPVDESLHVDYLFQRLFALVLLLLRASGRS